MEHKLRSWGPPACVCGYRYTSADRSHANKMIDIHLRSRHDFHEHIEIIRQLVAQTAAKPNANQDVALAILHLAEGIEQLETTLSGLELDHEPDSDHYR